MRENNFLGLETNIPWKDTGGLLLPSNNAPASKSAISQFMGTYLGYRDITGRETKLGDFHSALSNLNCQTVLALLSKMALMLHNHGSRDKDLQLLIIQPFLTNEDYRIATERLNQKDKIVLVTHNQQIYFLIKAALIHCPDHGPGEIINDHERISFGKILLWANDLLATNELPLKGSESVVEKRLRLFIWGLRNMAINSHDQMRYMIVRFGKMYRDLKSDTTITTAPDFIDLDALFLEATGGSLDIFFSVGVAAYSIYQQYKGTGPEAPTEQFFIDASSMFARSKLSVEIIKRALNLLAVDLPEARKQMEEEEDQFPRETYAFQTLRHNPLLHLNDHATLCLAPELLAERVTTGIYWILFDYLDSKKDEDRKNKLMRFHGILFERYIQDLFKRMFKNDPNRVVTEFLYKKTQDTFKTSDVFLAYPKTLVLIEVVGSRMNMINTIIRGNFEAYERDITKMVVDKARQISRVIDDFTQGNFTVFGLGPKNITRFIPIVVCPQSVPQNDLVWQDIQTRLMGESILIQDGVEKLTMLDAEECETAEAFVQNKKSFLELIEKKLSSEQTCALSFKNFIFKEFGEEPSNQEMMQSFRAMMDQSIDALYVESNVTTP